MLRIQLFGPPIVYNDDQPIVIKRRATRALLFYLAAQGKPVTRDHLTDSFWPDLELTQARATLRDNLAKLRTDLPDKEIIQAQPDLVSLDFSKVWVDYIELQGLFTKITPALHRLSEEIPLPATLYNQMAEAVGLWKGEPFIANGELSISEELSLWVERVQVPLNETLRLILRRLSKHDEIVGNIGKMLEWLRLIRAFDEYDDEINRKIIEAYLRNRMQPEAQEFYQMLRSLYEDELGADVPADILALEPRIYAPPTQPIMSPAQWTVRPSMQTPFIGQAEILGQLDLAYRTGGGLLVMGEAGAGKTRLVQEFVRQQENVMHPVVASCQPLDTGMPFAPWINLMRSSVAPEHWQRLEPIWVSPLTLLMPDLSGIRPDVPAFSPLRPEVPRSILLEAIHQLLVCVAENGPLLLFIDDVHWADESTLALISYLMHKSFFRAGHGLLIMAARLEEPNALLDKLLLTSYPQPLRRAEIRHLTRDEIVLISSYIIEKGAPQAFIDRLFQESGGNPFFLLQLLQSLQELDADLEQVQHLPMTQSVHELIQRRLTLLPTQARDLLSTAAVLGSYFELPVIEEAMSISAEEVVAALERLERARLVRHLQEDGFSYGFVHEKIRESLLAELTPSRKRLLNQRVATALETKLAGNLEAYSARLAQYHENAGNLLEAFNYWVMAGQYAWRLDSTHEAIDAYKHAQRLIPRTTGITDEQLYQLYAHWNQVAFGNDDPVLLDHINQEVHALGKQRKSDLLIGVALVGLSDAAMARNHFSEAYKYVQEAYPYLEHSQHAYELIQAEMKRGTYLYMLGQVNEAQTWFRKIIESTEGTDDPQLINLRAVSYYHMGLSETIRGYPRSGIEHANKSAEAISRIRSTYGDVEAYSVLGLAHFLNADYQAGREICLKAMTLADRMAGWRMLGYVACYAGMNEVELAMVGDAWEHAQRAIEIGRRQGHGEIIGLGYRSIGNLYLQMGAYEKAAQAFQEGVAGTGEHFVTLENMYRYGYAQLLLGQKEAYTQIEQAVDKAAAYDVGCIGVYGGVPFQLAALLKLGEHKIFEQKAEAYIQQLLERSGTEKARYTVMRFRADDALERGDYENAHALAETLVPWFRQLSTPWFELNCLRIQRVSARHLSLSAAGVEQRMLELLDQVSSSIRNAPFQAEFQAYRASVLTI